MLKDTPVYRGIALAGMMAREMTRSQSLPRIPEPEPTMEDEVSVEGFHLAGEALMPVYHFNALAVSRRTQQGGTVVDLGSGSGRFLAYLAEVRPDLRIVGMDLSKAMVKRGQRFLQETGLAERVSLKLGDMTDFADDFQSPVDMVCSVFALHHLPTREHLLRTFKEIKAVRQKFGCAVWLFDLQRPRCPGTPKSFPEILTPDTPTVFKEDTTNSLNAAWSYREMLDSLAEAGLGESSHRCSPLLRFYQTHWLESRHSLASGHDRWVAGEGSLAAAQVFEKLKWLLPKDTA